MLHLCDVLCCSPRRLLMADKDKVDKPSDIEFAKAITQHIPEPNWHVADVVSAAYIGYKVTQRANKRK